MVIATLRPKEAREKQFQKPERESCLPQTWGFSRGTRPIHDDLTGQEMSEQIVLTLAPLLFLLGAFNDAQSYCKRARMLIVAYFFILCVK